MKKILTLLVLFVSPFVFASDEGLDCVSRVRALMKSQMLENPEGKIYLDVSGQGLCNAALYEILGQIKNDKSLAQRLTTLNLSDNHFGVGGTERDPRHDARLSIYYILQVAPRCVITATGNPCVALREGILFLETLAIEYGYVGRVII